MDTITGKGTCFVISPIGPRDSLVRARADRVFKYVIEPAAAECGYQALRSDLISEPGMITRQVITQVIDAPMVVADLTDHNPNVFYELAIRHAIGKPVVKIIQTGQSIPFDVGQSRTISLDHTDLASADECRKELVLQIRAAEQAPHDADNPITEAVTLNGMRQSDDPERQQLGEVLGLLQDVLGRLGRLEAAQVPDRLQPAAWESSLAENPVLHRALLPYLRTDPAHRSDFNRWLAQRLSPGSGSDFNQWLAERLSLDARNQTAHGSPSNTDPPLPFE